MGLPFLLPQLIGQARASNMFYLGEPLKAVDAERIGLVAKVVPNPRHFCVELATNADSDLQRIKKNLKFGISAGNLEEAIRAVAKDARL